MPSSQRDPNVARRTYVASRSTEGGRATEDTATTGTGLEGPPGQGLGKIKEQQRKKREQQRKIREAFRKRKSKEPKAYPKFDPSGDPRLRRTLSHRRLAVSAKHPTWTKQTCMAAAERPGTKAFLKRGLKSDFVRVCMLLTNAKVWWRFCGRVWGHGMTLEDQLLDKSWRGHNDPAVLYENVWRLADELLGENFRAGQSNWREKERDIRAADRQQKKQHLRKLKWVLVLWPNQEALERAFG